MHARLDHGRVKLLIRTGLDWTLKYPAISGAFATLHADTAYLDGELCGVRPDGTTSFTIIQNAPGDHCGASLVFYLRSPLPGRKSLLAVPLIERKRCLQTLLSSAPDRLHYSDHHMGRGRSSSSSRNSTELRQEAAIGSGAARPKHPLNRRRSRRGTMPVASATIARNAGHLWHQRQCRRQVW
jgi:ATP-dependent DNA ligase